MKIRNLVVALVAAVLLAPAAQAEEGAEGGLRSINSAGPRFGFVYASGAEVQEALKRREASSVLTAFGWQFEYEYLNTGGGTTGLIEFVPLVVGLESGIAIPSGSLLIGVRFAGGFELGVGPNMGAIIKDDPLNTSGSRAAVGVGMAVAVGVTARSGRMNFPINLAAVRNANGYRTALMVGWTL